MIKIINMGIFFVFLVFTQLNAIEKNNIPSSPNQTLSDSYFHTGYPSLFYPVGLYVCSYNSGLLGLLLLGSYPWDGSATQRQSVYLLTAGAYNLVLANQMPREVAFLTNLAIWGVCWAAFSGNSVQSTENAKQNVQVMPVISPAGYQIGCNIQL